MALKKEKKYKLRSGDPVWVNWSGESWRAGLFVDRVGKHVIVCIAQNGFNQTYAMEHDPINIVPMKAKPPKF